MPNVARYPVDVLGRTLLADSVHLRILSESILGWQVANLIDPGFSVIAWYDWEMDPKDVELAIRNVQILQAKWKGEPEVELSGGKGLAGLRENLSVYVCRNVLSDEGAVAKLPFEILRPWVCVRRSGPNGTSKPGGGWPTSCQGVPLSHNMKPRVIGNSRVRKRGGKLTKERFAPPQKRVRTNPNETVHTDASPKRRRISKVIIPQGTKAPTPPPPPQISTIEEDQMDVTMTLTPPPQSKPAIALPKRETVVQFEEPVVSDVKEVSPAPEIVRSARNGSASLSPEITFTSNEASLQTDHHFVQNVNCGNPLTQESPLQNGNRNSRNKKAPKSEPIHVKKKSTKKKKKKKKRISKSEAPWPTDEEEMARQDAYERQWREESRKKKADAAEAIARWEERQIEKGRVMRAGPKIETPGRDVESGESGSGGSGSEDGGDEKETGWWNAGGGTGLFKPSENTAPEKKPSPKRSSERDTKKRVRSEMDDEDIPKSRLQNGEETEESEGEMEEMTTPPSKRRKLNPQNLETENEKDTEMQNSFLESSDSENDDDESDEEEESEEARPEGGEEETEEVIFKKEAEEETEEERSEGSESESEMNRQGNRLPSIPEETSDDNDEDVSDCSAGF